MCFTGSDGVDPASNTMGLSHLTHSRTAALAWTSAAPCAARGVVGASLQAANAGRIATTAARTAAAREAMIEDMVSSLSERLSSELMIRREKRAGVLHLPPGSNAGHT